MNKYLCIFIIFISFFSVLSFVKDMKNFPAVQSGEFVFLKSFKNEFPQIKQLGFYSDLEYPSKILFRIQNTVIPTIVDNNVNYNEVFCYSENFLCHKFVLNGSAILLKQYSDNLFLLQKPKEGK